MKLLFENWRKFLTEEKDPEISDRDVFESIGHLNNEEGEEDKYSKEDFEIKYYGKLKVDDVIKMLDEPTDWLTLDPEEIENEVEQYKKDHPGQNLEDEDIKNMRLDYVMNKEDFDRGEFESRMEFFDRAENWIESGDLPPVYIIQNSKLENILGDGRGRLNIARAFNLEVPVFYMRLVRHRTEEPTIYR